MVGRQSPLTLCITVAVDVRISLVLKTTTRTIHKPKVHTEKLCTHLQKNRMEVIKEISIFVSCFKIQGFFTGRIYLGYKCFISHNTSQLFRMYTYCI